ncbi:MAG TPA: tetratricopeptide repeat protein [Vicinamibacterales bacterium]
MKQFAVIAIALLLLGAAPEAVKFLNEGIGWAKRGDLKRAEESIAKAIAIDPQEAPDYPVHFWHGVVLSALGDEAGARKEWSAAGRNPELNRRLFAMKASTPQQRAESARSDAMFLGAHNTKSFRAAEDAMKGGKFDEAQALYARAPTEPRSQLVTMVRVAPPPPPPPQPMQTATRATVTEGTTQPMTTTTGTTATTATTATTPTTTTTGTTTGTTATSTSPDVFEEIKKRFEDLSPGTVVFNAPDQMKVSNTETVVVRIAPKGEASGITSGLSGGTSTAPQEHITPTMAAKLDGIGFDIAPLTPETQLVAGGGFAEWRWDVTPSESGDHDLNLSIIAKLDQFERVVGTQTHHVHVATDPMGAFKDFFEKNWQWLASAIIIPLIALLWRSRAKRAD